MARKGENIFKRKDGRWEGRYIKGHEDGKVIYGYVFGKSYSEAKRKKSEALSALKSKISKANPIFKDIAVQWLNELREIRKNSTIAKYEAQLRNHIIPKFGDKRIDEIKNEDLMAFCNNLFSKRRKKKLSPKTISDILSRMASIRKFALFNGYEVKYFTKCITLPQKTEKIRVLSSREEIRLIKYLKSHLDPSNLGILLCLFTGLRIGELCALKWSDFSFEEQEIRVQRTMQRLRNLDGKTKTHIEIG